MSTDRQQLIKALYSLTHGCIKNSKATVGRHDVSTRWANAAANLSTSIAKLEISASIAKLEKLEQVDDNKYEG